MAVDSDLNSRHIQQKTEHLNSTANKIGLKINTKKNQVLRLITTNCNPILVNNKPLEDVEEFTYLGSKVTTTGDRDKFTNARIHRMKILLSVT